MNTPHTNHWSVSESDRRNQRRIVAWSLGWVLLLLAADYSIESDKVTSKVMIIAASIVVTLAGVGVLVTYRNFLRNADELVRKIELDALALAFGTGLVLGISYSLLATGSIVAEAKISNLIVVMTLTYVGAVIAGRRRFA